MKTIRHPEKQKNNSSISVKKPDWLKVRAPTSDNWKKVKDLMKSKKLVTVCEEAACPNIGECWSKKHATMMILGEIRFLKPTKSISNSCVAFLTLFVS